MNRPPIYVEDLSIPLCHITVAFDMGSIADPAEKEGCTALLLRLMRRSVPGLSAPELDEKLDRLGASVGVEVNRSVAAVHCTTLSRSLAPVLELLHGMICTPAFQADELQRLKAEADAEWVESLDSDSTLARRAFVQTIFSGHAYGRLTSGNRATLSRIELNDLQSLAPRLLNRGRLQLAFSGSFDRSLAEQFGTQLEQALPVADRSIEDPEDPAQRPGRHLIFVDKPERSQSQILIGCMGGHPADADYTALFVGNTVFGGTFSGRLSEEVRGKRGWSYGAYSSLPFDRRRQAFSMWTFPQAGDTAPCISLELQLLQTLLEKGITQRELNAAKKYLTNSHAFALDTASKRAGQEMDEAIYGLPDHRGYLDRIAAVDLKSVNEALATRLSSDNLVIAVLGTASSLVKEVEAVIPELASTTLVPFDA